MSRSQDSPPDPTDPPAVLRREGYEALRREWGWERARAELGITSSTVNLAALAVDRHVTAGRGEETALVELAGDGRRALTYRELRSSSNRLANALYDLGIGQGERVFSLLGRRLELHLTALGALKAGAVFSPLFTSFGPEPVRARLALGEARVLVTTELLYRRKVEPVRASLPCLEHVLIVGEQQPAPQSPGEDHLSFEELVANSSPEFEPLACRPDTPAFLHFTSGTTGSPKGALHVHDAIVAHYATARSVLGLDRGDTYWCTADPGWVTGISYGLVAPLAVGATSLIDREEFDAARWYGILQQERVNVWYTAPTAIRMLKRLGRELARGRDFTSLRHLASVGEPLESDAVTWGEEVFGRPFHDTWWQTETGAIMLANFAGLGVQPGSMGRPVPGVEACLVHRKKDSVSTVRDPAEVGELALRRGWPSMFRAYIGEPERYEKAFAGDWYLSGDLVRRDEAGFFWFVGRADDAIQSAGHLIGPFEVEQAMLEHPAVVDAAAVGKPDPLAFEIVTVALVLKGNVEASEELRSELLAHARRRLGPAVAPREISFYTELPKTPSGKIIRHQIRDASAGNPNT